MSGARDSDLLRRVEHLEAEIQELRELRAMGKGAFWITMRIGAGVAAVVAIILAIFSR